MHMLIQEFLFPYTIKATSILKIRCIPFPAHKSIIKKIHRKNEMSVEEEPAFGYMTYFHLE